MGGARLACCGARVAANGVSEWVDHEPNPPPNASDTTLWSPTRSRVPAGASSSTRAMVCAWCSDMPVAAVAAAVDIQRRLAAADWRAVDGLAVHVGIHTGEATVRDGDLAVRCCCRTPPPRSSGLRSATATSPLSTSVSTRCATSAPPSGCTTLGTGLRADFPPLRVESTPDATGVPKHRRRARAHRCPSMPDLWSGAVTAARRRHRPGSPNPGPVPPSRRPVGPARTGSAPPCRTARYRALILLTTDAASHVPIGTSGVPARL